jgi:hypothetical protein
VLGTLDGSDRLLHELGRAGIMGTGGRTVGGKGGVYGCREANEIPAPSLIGRPLCPGDQTSGQVICLVHYYAMLLKSLRKILRLGKRLDSVVRYTVEHKLAEMRIHVESILLDVHRL